MSKFGNGWGRDFHLLDSRPCNTNLTHLNQKLHNSRFQLNLSGGKFADERPEWWKKTVIEREQMVPQNQKKLVSSVQVVDGNTAERPTTSSKHMNFVPASERKVKVETICRTSSCGSGQSLMKTTPLSLIETAKPRNGPHFQAPVMPKVDIEMLSSHGGHSARSKLTTATSKGSRLSRLTSGCSSGRSGARSLTPSDYSGLTRTSSINQDEILQRIQGLEAALVQERTLRERMQALLEERAGSFGD